MSVCALLRDGGRLRGKTDTDYTSCTYIMYMGVWSIALVLWLPFLNYYSAHAFLSIAVYWK